MRISNLFLASAAALALSAAAAQAADVIYEEPMAPAPMVTATPYSWTGFYAGLVGGAATGDFDYNASFDGDDVLGAEFSAGGIFGGGQVGFDYQYNSFVFGAVADIFATDIDAEISATIPGLGSASATSELEYLGTVRARVGYAADRFMVYGHGGFAYGETEQTISISDGFDGQSFSAESGSKTGWTAGGGVEYAVTDSLSVQTEYSYYDLGEDTIYSDDFIDVSEDVTFHAVKAAVNFRF